MVNRKATRAQTLGINKKFCPMSKRSQVTIFIIIGVILVSLVAGYFLLKDRLFKSEIPASIEPVYNSFLSCLEQETTVGIDVLESQGGYINLPDFEPGSDYMPFSNELNFLGNPVPYWYYVAGNNIPKEEVPTKRDMEKELANFINEKIRGCELDTYYEQGFSITLGEPRANVNIKDNQVEVDLNMNMNIAKGEDNSIIKNHKVVVNSKLGELYNSAVEVYNKEQDSLFLENYAVDTLRLYAPVDGVELTCSPKTWNADKVFGTLKQAIEANTLALKSKGGDYSLNKKEDEYFVVDLGVSDNVRFINSENWSNAFEVNPSEGSMLISKPVGNQAGLGVLGFCYVAYHFVYNVKYPVLIQVYSGNEIFQFPVAVILQGNKPREALDATASQIQVSELCQHKNTPVEVSVHDTNLKPVDADISYECFGSSCEIGDATDGKLTANFPQCVNGYIETRAEGYVDSKYLLSTTESGNVDIILDKLYSMNVNLKLDGVNYRGQAIISFVSDKDSKTIVYPDQKEVELSEGQYEIQAFIYKNSSLSLESTTYQQCLDVPQSGVGGILGLTDQKCFDVEVPSQVVSNVLAGGGKQNHYILESELKSSSTIEINAESLPTPKSIEELQTNYVAFESKGLDIMFK